MAAKRLSKSLLKALRNGATEIRQEIHKTKIWENPEPEFPEDIPEGAEGVKRQADNLVDAYSAFCDAYNELDSQLDAMEEELDAYEESPAKP